MKIKPIFIILFIPIIVAVGCHSQKSRPGNPVNLPDSIYSGKLGSFHVQGIAVDKKHGYVYFSVADKLYKMDLSGLHIGSITNFGGGHLGDLAFDPKTDKIYGSLEYMNDAIGNGVRKRLGLKKKNKVGFYIAIIDGSRIVKPNMDAQKNDIMREIYLKEVVDDFEAKVKIGSKVLKHRFGCSGIDGVTLGPSIGKGNEHKKYLYVAYGIYGDTTRTDNNYQIILKYNISEWDTLSKKLSLKTPPHSGPEKPLAKYFVYTGNTRYGIQNLDYDPYTGNFFAAVYRGAKSKFPNYSLFVINGHKKPSKTKIISDDRRLTVDTLSLLQAGLKDPKTGIRGWDFKWGSTGLFSLGQGLFYISQNKKAKDGRQETTIRKYKWVGSSSKAFKLVK